MVKGNAHPRRWADHPEEADFGIAIDLNVVRSN
jgi:hypothetical protein